MALDYLTLSNKPKTILKDKDGNSQVCKDLLAVTTRSNIVDNGFEKCIVNKYYVARPDLISLAFYGTDEYADIICKINGISNPFELNENDMLNIPSVETVRYFASTNSKANELINDSTTIADKKKSKQKDYTTMRSPAEQVLGDTNYIIDRSTGLIFY